MAAIVNSSMTISLDFNEQVKLSNVSFWNSLFVSFIGSVLQESHSKF